MTTAAPAAAAAAPSPAPAPSPANEEEELRRQLRSSLQGLTRREPLDPSYRSLLGLGAARTPTLPRDKLYRRLGGELRARVEAFVASGGDDSGRKRGRQRDGLDEEKMRAAFTLREGKRHEQEGLVAAALAAPPRGVRLPPGWDAAAHRRRLEAMALGLQDREKKRKLKAERARLAKAAKAKILAAEREANAEMGRLKGSAAGTTDNAAALSARALAKAEEEIKMREQREQEEEERERLLAIERAKERERQRAETLLLQQEENEREREELVRRQRMAETPQQALHRLYEPIFKLLWELEFANLNNTNPFRIVIDSESCVSMGVPDYCDVIEKPMNLTFIQHKVENHSYRTLQEFFADVELMINNCLKYNSEPSNPFHIAAKEMRKKYRKMAKRVVQSLKQQQEQK